MQIRSMSESSEAKDRIEILTLIAGENGWNSVWHSVVWFDTVSLNSVFAAQCSTPPSSTKPRLPSNNTLAESFFFAKSNVWKACSNDGQPRSELRSVLPPWQDRWHTFSIDMQNYCLGSSRGKSRLLRCLSRWLHSHLHGELKWLAAALELSLSFRSCSCLSGCLWISL